MIKVREIVAERMKTLSTTVEEEVISTMVEREVDKRSALIVKGLDLLTDAEKVRNKIKPDLVGFAVDGKVTSESYSKSKLDELNKINSRIEKLTKAINKAIEGDLNDLTNLASGKDTGGDKSQSSAEDYS